MPESIRIVSFNCWGLKYISKLRRERLSYIAFVLQSAQPTPQIVGLQECWTQEDYDEIRDKTKEKLPYAKYYHSGVFGSGLAILSKWPIVESTMWPFSLNGRPTAFFRGDWYVGKGIACATILMENSELLEVFCTHLHAPYEQEPNDSYMCHRTCQAWEMSKLLRSARSKGRLAIALGDFNMLPASLAHNLISTYGLAQDTWRVLHPQSSLGSAIDAAEILRGVDMPSARFNLEENGATCDSILNTWRFTKDQMKELKRGKKVNIDASSADAKAKRLDYIFLGGNSNGWTVATANIGMVERLPHLLVSASDHFSVEVDIVRSTVLRDQDAVQKQVNDCLPAEIYQQILRLTDQYTQREMYQRRARIGHFLASLVISIGCLVAIWWSPRNFLSFILIILSSVGLTMGTIDGLIGFLFMSWELSCLKEFRWEIETAQRLSSGKK